jgi:hypothetical protein
MATNFDKMLTPHDMGQGITDGMDPEEGVIEIIIDGEEPLEEDDAEEEAFEANLAEEMSEGELQSISSELLDLVEADTNSRKDWVDAFVKGLEVLGMKYEERTEPWAGACGVYSTLLTEAAIRFQAEMITETFPAAGPVKTQIVGAVDRLKELAAERVRDDMNYQLTEVMIEYRPEHERMLYTLGLSGAAFKKVYYDPALGRQVSVFLPPEDVIIPYGATNVYNAERVTHVMRKTENEVRKLQVAGFYRDIDLGDPIYIFTDVEKKKAEEQGYSLTDDNRYQFLEIHVDYDLPGYEDDDGIALPYVITIEKGTQTILAIRRNWDEDDKHRLKRQHFVQYTYIPGFGAYGLGLIHLIGGYARAGTSLIRQLVDAGSLSNLPGGLKARGLRIKGDDTPIAPGEFRDVDVPSGTVRDNIMPLPYKEPSQTLLALLNQITEEGRRLGAISDMNISDMSSNAPVGTTLALLERTLKTMSAVQARVHASLRMEFKLLKAIIRDNTPKEYSYEPDGGDRKAKQADYDYAEVMPVSDPNAATMAQRIMQYQAAIQLAQGAPQIYDLPQLHRQMLEVLGIRNADKLVPVDEDQTPKDPISENMAFLVGKPTKAFIYQDHDAHITTHTSLLQDPSIMQMIGQSPMAQQMQSAIMAHVAQHLAFSYRANVEKQLGVPLPDPDVDMPEEIEVQVSRLVAQASQQLLQINQQNAQQQQQEQQAQDPMMQLKQAELEIQKQEQQRKQQKDQAENQLAQQRLQLDAQRIQAEIQKEQARVQADAHKMAVTSHNNAIAEAQRTQAEVEKERIRVQADTHKMAATSRNSTQAEAIKSAAQQKMHNQKIQADLIKHITKQQKPPGAQNG